MKAPSKQTIELYSLIGWLSMIAVPIAPAFYFGFSFAQSVYKQVFEFSGNVQLATITAVLIGAISAFGLESVGILAGHNAVKFWGQGENGKALLSGGVLVAYVAFGIAGLEDVFSKGVVMFLIAPFVYFQVAIQKDAEVKHTEVALERQDDREWQRKMERLEKEQKHIERMAKIEVKSVKSPQGSQPVRSQFADEPVKHYECVCGRVFDGSRSYNAHRRHCEVPANEPAKIYENGHHK